MHPYEMASTLRERNKEDSIKINYGSLYSVVESLRKRGLITNQETTRDSNRPERTIYAITADGETEMREWLTDLLARPDKEFTRFEAALSLMPILDPDEVLELLAQRIKALEEIQCRRQEFTSSSNGFFRLFMVENRYQQSLIAAETEFVRELITELRNDDFQQLSAWRRLHELKSAGKPPEELFAQLIKEFKEDASWLERSNEKS